MNPLKIWQVAELVELKPSSRSLSKTYIHHNITSLFEAFTELRLVIDLIVSQALDHRNQAVHSLSEASRFFFGDSQLHELYRQEFQNVKKQELQHYPIGMCSHITKTIVLYIKQLDKSSLDRWFPGLRHYLEQGGIFKRIWGEVRTQYFQTAIQMGDIYLDVANDTVDLKKPKTEWKTLEDCDFSNITCFEVYRKISKTYHRKIQYLNTSLPYFSPLVPLWYRYENSQLYLDANSAMMSLAHITDYNASESFLRKHLLNKEDEGLSPLPNFYQMQLESIISQYRGVSEFTELFQFTSLAVSADSCQAFGFEKFDELRSMKDDEKKSYYRRVLQHIKFINFQLYIIFRKQESKAKQEKAEF